MLGIKTGWYWRICWAIITPALMIAIFVYNLVTYEPVTYKGHEYPQFAYGKLSALCPRYSLKLKQ